MPPRRRTASTLALSAGIGAVLALSAALPAHAAEPFPDDRLRYDYPSNAAYDYVPILDAWSGLVADEPGIIALNDSKTVTINNNATALESERAIVDQYADMSVSMADGLGRNLGAIYAAAREAGELPKTAALLAKNGGLIGYYSSSNPAKDHFDYDRPYIRFGEDLVYRDREGGDAWGSTSGAYPSGHTSQAYWQGTALATMLPELAPQILARTSEAGHNRVIMAAHYPLDVMSGRMMGQHIVERRWSDPEFRVLLTETAQELRAVLEAGCGAALADCIAADTPYLTDADALAVYRERLSYGFPLVGDAGQPVTVPANAESLLLSSHPTLTDDQRRQVLALTAIDSGFPLDKGADGSWQRLDLAAAMTTGVEVAQDGTVTLVAPGAENPGTGTPTDPGAENPGDPTAGEPGAGNPDAPNADQPGAQNPVTDGAGSGGNTLPVAGARDRASTNAALAATGTEVPTLAVAGVATVLLAGGLSALLVRRRLSRR